MRVNELGMCVCVCVCVCMWVKKKNSAGGGLRVDAAMVTVFMNKF
jgi:hypothetical protein